MLNNKLDAKMYSTGMQNGGGTNTYSNGVLVNGSHKTMESGSSMPAKKDETSANNQVSSTTPNNALVPQSKALMLTNVHGLYKVFSTESVLNLLCCLYCKKPYKDPRLLHCGHTYCLPCLVQMNRYSTIRCLKCNSLQTVTSHAVDTLPKNLFVADIQCIPTVEIDRGAAYKETLKSLEELKSKLLDFSDKLDQSEQKLYQTCEMKKREVSEQISRVIEQIRLLEEEFHNEIDEFKNNRLSVLRSAPPEFKETNANLLQFVNQSLEDMMRPDIKEEDVKEIYNRCEEHRRLWNETEIIFNSNYAIGEISFQKNETLPQKDLIGAIVQKFPQKLYAQRTAKGPMNFTECCIDGTYIILENTSKRHDVNMTNWVLTHCVSSVRKVSYKFPENFILKSRQSVKLWAANRSAHVSNGKPNSCAKMPTKALNGSNGHSVNGHHNGVNGTANGSSANGGQNGHHHGHHHHHGHQNGNGHSDGKHDNGDEPAAENELFLDEIENWTCGSQEIFIRLENEFGEEKACFRKTS